ncbi:hypothetical protein RN96_10420 [Fusobacterium polymorphum]|uniref:YopX protein domain-containing protein n=1 Tax=Fusobacterium nucleatum subsp. polymorphum TaxID=76857 RepID=A0A2B7Y936_FUSNP|nr:YopX family protein [Fusobacterium polymorphum]PGH20584.1 hypothetical protein RN96_10420 [Fusobacterium polymorphum]
MREIKFRAWHKEKKIMGEVLGIDILHKEIFFSNGDIDCYGFLDFKYIELMEYTGLKDMGGKEIFESDILLSSNENGIFLISIDFGDPDREEVNTLKGFKMKTKKVLSESQYFEYFNNKLIELIDKYSIPVEEYNNEKYISDGWWILGNIYENPELLGEKNDF